jgi:hypothetical protein
MDGRPIRNGKAASSPGSENYVGLKSVTMAGTNIGFRCACPNCPKITGITVFVRQPGDLRSVRQRSEGLALLSLLQRLLF